MEEDPKKLVQMIQLLDIKSREVGLEINPSKIKSITNYKMVVTKKDDISFEYVQEYTFI